MTYASFALAKRQCRKLAQCGVLSFVVPCGDMYRVVKCAVCPINAIYPRG